MQEICAIGRESRIIVLLVPFSGSFLVTGNKGRFSNLFCPQIQDSYARFSVKKTRITWREIAYKLWHVVVWFRIIRQIALMYLKPHLMPPVQHKSHTRLCCLSSWVCNDTVKHFHHRNVQAQPWNIWPVLMIVCSKQTHKFCEPFSDQRTFHFDIWIEKEQTWEAVAFSESRTEDHGPVLPAQWDILFSNLWISETGTFSCREQTWLVSKDRAMMIALERTTDGVEALISRIPIFIGSSWQCEAQRSKVLEIELFPRVLVHVEVSRKAFSLQ